MPVTLNNRVRNAQLDTRALRATAQALLEAVGEGNASLSLTFVRDPAIRRLNQEYRGKDKPTDVLSFPLHEPGSPGPGDPAGDDEDGPPKLLGDVVISIDTALRQASEYDAPVQREIERLLIHGILHLMGHDHERVRERARMEREERRLADAIGMPWPY